MTLTTCNHTIASATLALLVLLLGSCENNDVSDKNINSGYYAIDSLIEGQIGLLVNTNTHVTKVALLDGKENRTTLEPKKKQDWVQELDPFIDLNEMNKPINKGLYKIEDVADSKSNLRIKTFMSTTQLPVEYLKIYYHRTPKRIRKIESKYTAENLMYKGTRFLIMEFDEINSSPVLTYYSIYGGQKMFLGDTVTYTINAIVSLED